MPLTSLKHGNCPEMTILNFLVGQSHGLGLGSDIGLGHSSNKEMAGRLKIKYSFSILLKQGGLVQEQCNKSLYIQSYSDVLSYYIYCHIYHTFTFSCSPQGSLELQNWMIFRIFGYFSKGSSRLSLSYFHIIILPSYFYITHHHTSI